MLSSGGRGSVAVARLLHPPRVQALAGWKKPRGTRAVRGAAGSGCGDKTEELRGCRCPDLQWRTRWTTAGCACCGGREGASARNRRLSSDGDGQLAPKPRSLDSAHHDQPHCQPRSCWDPPLRARQTLGEVAQCRLHSPPRPSRVYRRPADWDQGQGTRGHDHARRPAGRHHRSLGALGRATRGSWNTARFAASP